MAVSLGLIVEWSVHPSALAVVTKGLLMPVH